MLARLVDDTLTKVVEYCTKDETRVKLESQVLAPVLKYLGDKFAWSVRLFQAIAILVFIQTLMLLWLLFREHRIYPPVVGF